jgi:class 3 adenylate cyclase
MERQPPDEAGRPPADDGVGSAIHTFLIADVRGYTLFTQERGDEAAAKLAAKFAGIAREGVEGRGGSVIELRGDEALAVFSSARQAIRAALDLQERFVAESIADANMLLPVGIGLDAGEAVPVETGYRGGALNLAARLCGQAGPGEVLASREVTHLARRMDGVRYEDRGSIQLKGLTEPVPIVRISSEAIDTTAPFVGMAPRREAMAPPGSRPWGPRVDDRGRRARARARGGGDLRDHTSGSRRIRTGSAHASWRRSPWRTTALKRQCTMGSPTRRRTSASPFGRRFRPPRRRIEPPSARSSTRTAA